MKWPLIVFVVLGAAGFPVLATSSYLSPDVPTDLAGATYQESDILRDNSGAYSLVLSLPPGTPVDALHRMCSGNWLLSVEAPTDLGGIQVEARDLVEFDGLSAYTLFFCGAGVGLPDGTDLDAAFLLGDDGSDLVLSFDVPTDIAGIIYEPADLVQFARTGPGCAGWSVVGPWFDASTTMPPVPLSSNVTGADVRGGQTIITFDVPTTLSGSTYLPGEYVSWNASGFASYRFDPNWPISSRVDALSFLPGPGVVPPGSLYVKKSSTTPGNLVLNWSPSTSIGAEDYGIYEGTLGSWYSHYSKVCTDSGGDLTEEITPASGNTYYLVVPLNSNDEGSYGTDSSGSQRPPGTSPCRLTQDLDCP